MWSTCVEGVIGIFIGGDILTGFFGGVLVKFQWVFDTFFFFLGFFLVFVSLLDLILLGQ